MDTILNFNITVTLLVQSMGDWLGIPMILFSFLGNEVFYLFVAPVLYWCINASLGFRLGLLLMISGAINSNLKIIFHQPRPYWYSTEVSAYSSESSFGFPSGHAQNAVVVWGTIANWIRRLWTWILAILIIFLIGFSRIYLGVHSPSDVIAGWLVGVLILWVYVKLEEPVSRWLGVLGPFYQTLVALSVSLSMVFLGAIALNSLGDWTIPESWILNAAQAAPGTETIDPLALSGMVSNAGAFFGMAAGWIFIKHNGGFDAGGKWWQRLVRFGIGLLIVGLIWTGLGAVFPRGEDVASLSLRYIRYTLVGFWIIGLAPFLFIRLKLANTS
ncbi:MAG: phosphatase PAP2 family protein [Anaerolineales bacterium]